MKKNIIKLLISNIILVCVLEAVESCTYRQGYEDKSLKVVLEKKKPEIMLTFIDDERIESEYVVQGNMLYDSRFLLHKKELELSHGELKDIKQLLSGIDIETTFTEKPYSIEIREGDGGVSRIDTIYYIIEGGSRIELSVNNKLVYYSELPNEEGIYYRTIMNLKSFFDSLFTTNRVTCYED